ncbi:MAG: lipid A biosynthesis acyltransferase [Bacteroidales bacterium]|nr:lipid A biosynthesis acyltransferase [Bacteroidales bacterium]
MNDKSWTGRSKGGKTGYQIFVFLLKHAGLRTAYVLLRFVAFYYFVTPRSSTRYSYQFFRKIGFGKPKSIISLYRNYYVFGQSLVDKISAMAGFGDRFSFYFEGEVNLHQMVKNGKGGILLSAHAGNWEIAGHYLDRLNTTVNIVMYDAEYESIKNYLQRVTGKRKANIITIRNDMSHVYQIMEALNKNELICMHADRLLNRTQRTISRPFLGEDALFPYSIFKMINTFGVPVSFVYAFREPGFHYHFYATEAFVYSGKQDVSLDEISRDYVMELERKVRQYPLQWFNYFNFWEK